MSSQTQAILNKIKRNLDMLGIDSTLGATSITVTTYSTVISYTDNEIVAPMGGIDPSTSPFLGIGKGNPGTIKFKGAAGENTIAAIFDNAVALKIVAMLGGFANSKVIEAGDTTTELAFIQGHEDLVGMGQ
jgi:hypothetical protein